MSSNNSKLFARVGRMVAAAVVLVAMLPAAMAQVAGAKDPNATPAAKDATTAPAAKDVTNAKDVAVVCNVKVVSDKVADVSTLEAWKKSFLEGKKTDQEKALAIWASVVTHQHQDSPPCEYLQNENLVLDPLKIWNVYGYSFCGVAAAEINGLARYCGLETRGFTIVGHVVPEVKWDGEWHMLDASLINYFPKSDGKIASIAEIETAVQTWLAANPDYKGNDKKLREFHFAEAKKGWKKGPELLSICPFYTENGWWPAKTHGWYSTMQEYDGSGKTPFEYECGFSLSYQLNIQLRDGERLTRNWSNKGLHVNMLDEAGKDGPGCMKMNTGENGLIYTPKYGDIAPGRVGNGTLVYCPTLDANLEKSAVRFENLQKDLSSNDRVGDFVLSPADASKPGVLVIHMPSSYVYLTGELTFVAKTGGSGSIVVSISDNNGLDWKEVVQMAATGDQKIDLKKFIFRRYDYRLKFELKGAGTSVTAMKLSHDIQHSQRPLPALGQGENKIAFTAGPQTSTLTLEGSCQDGNKSKQLIWSDFHPKTENLDGLVPKGTGTLTFPVQTPGEMTRIRMGCFWRGWDGGDGWDASVSLNGGKTFKDVWTFGKSTAFNSRYGELTDIPAGTKSALVRYTGTQKGTLRLLNFNINADYKAPAAGFKPVRITYVWEEGGVQKTDEHVAKSADEAYTIKCEAKPTMKSITLELAN